MVTRKPVPPRAVPPQTSNNPPYASSPSLDQAPLSHRRASKSSSTSPTFYKMSDPWADEGVDGPNTSDQFETLPRGPDGRQNSEEARVQEENLPSSLRAWAPDSKEETAEEHPRFKSPILPALRPSRLDVDRKRQPLEEPEHGINTYNGTPSGTHSWQSSTVEGETVPNVWHDEPTSPVASVGALPPPPPVENKTGVLMSIRAAVKATVVVVS